MHRRSVWKSGEADSAAAAAEPALVAEVRAALARMPVTMPPTPADFASPEELWRMLVERARRRPVVRTSAGFVANDAYSEAHLLSSIFTGSVRLQCRVNKKPAPATVFAQLVDTAAGRTKQSREKAEPELAKFCALAAAEFRKRNSGAFAADRGRAENAALYEALYLVAPMCTSFNPELAAAMIEHGAALAKVPVAQARVLDSSSGWGDRAIGAALAGVAEYYGIDPNNALVAGYSRLAEFLRRVANHTMVQFVCEPFEKTQVGGFDILVSSPPFGNYEEYVAAGTDRSSQSNHLRSDLEWRSQWLFPAVSQMIQSVRVGGVVMLYLNDIHGCEFVRPLLDYVFRKHALTGRHETYVVQGRTHASAKVLTWVRPA